MPDDAAPRAPTAIRIGAMPDIDICMAGAARAARPDDEFPTITPVPTSSVPIIVMPITDSAVLISLISLFPWVVECHAPVLNSTLARADRGRADRHWNW